MKKVIDLAGLRGAVGKTQTEIANILGVQQSYVSEIENGKKNVSKRGEEVLIAQFGKDICDQFRVDKVDCSIRPTFNGAVKAHKQQFAQNLTEIEHSNTSNSDLQEQLTKCQVELAKTQKELEQANKRIDKLLAIIENLSKEQ